MSWTNYQTTKNCSLLSAGSQKKTTYKETEQNHFISLVLYYKCPEEIKGKKCEESVKLTNKKILIDNYALRNFNTIKHFTSM